jgi:hypothetical protein
MKKFFISATQTVAVITICGCFFAGLWALMVLRVKSDAQFHALKDCQEITFYEAHAEKCDIIVKGVNATALSTKEYWLNEAVKNIEVK